MIFASAYRSYKAAGFLARIVSGRPPALVNAPRLMTTTGVEYDLYEPDSDPSGAHILLYGMTHAGERDIRIVRLANSFVASGLRVAVPVLPGLKSFDFRLNDLEILCDLIDVLQRRFGKPIRITGFSVGAGLALLAAAQPQCFEHVDLLLLFSPHHSLTDIWLSLGSRPRPDPGDENKWQIFIWHQTALAYHHRQLLHLSVAERREFEFIMRNYATEAARAESFYLEVLAEKDVPSFGEIAVDEDVLRALSPAGKLADLPARVLIFHDPYDERYSPAHSERIMAELKQRSDGAGQRLLITPLIAHAGARRELHISDFLTILSMFSDVFAVQIPTAGR